MEEVREGMVRAMNGVLDGEVPLRTAKEAHLAAHRIVMNNYEECKEEELGMRRENINETMDAMRKV